MKTKNKKKNVVLNKFLSIVLVISFLVSSSALVLAYVNYRIVEGGEWVCIAKTCSAWSEGDDWIVKHCRPEGDDKELICSFEYNERMLEVPLSEINTSNVRSCNAYDCITEVYVRGSIQEEWR